MYGWCPGSSLPPSRICLPFANSTAHSVDRLFVRQSTIFQVSTAGFAYPPPTVSFFWLSVLVLSESKSIERQSAFCFWDHFNENNITTISDLLSKGFVYSRSNDHQSSVIKAVWLIVCAILASRCHYFNHCKLNDSF